MQLANTLHRGHKGLLINLFIHHRRSHRVPFALDVVDHLHMIAQNAQIRMPFATIVPNVASSKLSANVYHQHFSDDIITFLPNLLELSLNKTELTIDTGADVTIISEQIGCPLQAS